MRKITFRADEYKKECINEERVKAGLDTEKKEAYVYQGEGTIGLVELFWMHFIVSKKELTKKEAKICKRLKTTLKGISRFKDNDEDSRIANEGPQTIVLEEDEWELAKELHENAKYKPVVAEEYDELGDLLDNAEKIEKPKLVEG